MLINEFPHLSVLFRKLLDKVPIESMLSKGKLPQAKVGASKD